MMDKKGYYLILGKKAKKIWHDTVEAAKKLRREANEWMTEHGGDGIYLTYKDSHVAAIQADKCPGKYWREHKDHKGMYVPKCNSKVGRALYAEMEQLRTCMTRESVGKAFLGHGGIFDGTRLLRCGWESTSKGVIISVTDPPADNKEQWKPIPGVRKLKDSEYWKIVEAPP
jgi:hypothetical protein